MRVEIWTDIICPWCGIGHARLEEALARFAHRDEVELVHRSFQLDERAPEGRTMKAREMLRTKKGMSDAQIDAVVGRIERMAAEDGLSPYIVADNLVGNTSRAHELAAWATDEGRGPALWSALYRAYFREGRSIFDVDVLLSLAEEAGLDVAGAREVLDSRRYAERVRDEGRRAVELGASGVPFVVVDGRYAIPGAVPVDTILRALDAAWSSRADATPEGEACGVDGCEA